MNISLEQAYVGFKFDAIWRKQQLCHHCAGKGGASMITCPKCHGHGTLNSRSILNNFEFSNWKNFSETTVEGDDHHHHRCGHPPGNNHYDYHNNDASSSASFTQEQLLRCTVCNGRGEIPHQTSRCPHCNGSGVIEVEKRTVLAIPRGIPNGHRMSLEGEGHENHQLRPGNLVLKVNILPHSTFQRAGNNLIAQLNMTIKEAKNGFQRNITHLNGTKFVFVREGITPPGLRLRVFNAGMPCFDGKTIFDEHLKNKKYTVTNKTRPTQKGQCYGDLLVSFSMHIPQHIRRHSPFIFEDLSMLGKAMNEVTNASYTLHNE